MYSVFYSLYITSIYNVTLNQTAAQVINLYSMYTYFSSLCDIQPNSPSAYAVLVCRLSASAKPCVCTGGGDFATSTVYIIYITIILHSHVYIQKPFTSNAMLTIATMQSTINCTYPRHRLMAMQCHPYIGRKANLNIINSLFSRLRLYLPSHWFWLLLFHLSSADQSLV